jgi:glycosyltransferase involved in cell wall biosynthesis
MLAGVNTYAAHLVSFLGKYMSRAVLNRLHPDIFHETYYSAESYRPKGARSVLTVYDCIHERYPEFFPDANSTISKKKAAAERADSIICISNSTRSDLIDFYGISPEKIAVIYLGVDQIFMREVQGNRIYMPSERPFILYVGERYGYKNFNRLLRSFISSYLLKSEFSLICFGGGPLKVEELRLAARLGFRPGQLVHIEGGDEELAKAYGHAEALVYPSLYEGFGMPLIEAMACGCPVVSSNASSLPEVLGDAGEYFDPTDEFDMSQALERVLSSPGRRAQLVALGLQRQSIFTWQRCALDTHQIYQKIL